MARSLAQPAPALVQMKALEVGSISSGVARDDVDPGQDGGVAVDQDALHLMPGEHLKDPLAGSNARL